MGTLVEQQVAHIWRRLGFGATAADLDHGIQVGPAALVNELLARPLTTPAQWAFTASTTWQGQISFLGRQLALMSSSPNPLQERLAWILQGLVVVGQTDAVQFPDQRDHLLRLRGNPFASYTRLLRDTAIMPGMMKYLNGYQNSAEHPNQNYARELMELFSLGITNPLTGAQNYSQTDVVEIARALTGFTYNWKNGRIVFDATQFDAGTKTFFGVNHGDAGLKQVISAICHHPSFRTFVPARLYREFVGTDPDPVTLARLGELFGTTGNVRAVVKYIARSPDFFSPAVIGNKVKTPVELLVSGAKVMRFDLGPSDYGWQLSGYMNQHPMYPPNVAGWPSGDIWLNCGVTMAWCNIVTDFTNASLSSPQGTVTDLLAGARRTTAAASAARLCGLSTVSTTTMSALTTHVNAGAWNRKRAAGLLALILVSPEFAIS